MIRLILTVLFFVAVFAFLSGGLHYTQKTPTSTVKHSWRVVATDSGVFLQTQTDTILAK
ncbi:hypothetical protein [Hymenobacter koreensis]|uniref:Uncharacterized protein n=1 Tax=Hymenobacter koreensis TaxID=1084523 RepID=A0ABP8JK19_9BACT